MAQLVDIYGRPLKREALKTTQSVRVAERLRIYPDHPSRGLNIRKLPRILEAAERGYLPAQAMLFADMEERDGHLFAEMEKRKKALLTLDWSVEPPRNASKAEKELAAAVDEWLHGIPDMEDIILNGMSSVGYGFSCQEISWAFVDKTWLPDAVTLRPHNWFITLPEHNDELRLDDGNCGEDGKDGSALWPFGWLVHRYNARSGFLGSSGLFRVLVWPYLFKNFALRDMAEFLEIYGLPARIAYYAQGTSDADRDNILEALVNLGHEAVAALPQGNEIEFKEAASGGPESLREVLGTGWSAHRGFALSTAELDAMLSNAAQELTREREIERQLSVAAPHAARLDAGERQELAARYTGLTFTETYITPSGGRLPPAFSERAKALHHRLDKLLRQQRERSAGQRTGALSQRELWKIPLDAKDVFRRKAPPSQRETAFYLLIDRSGSMGSGVGGGQSKLFTALATAAILEEALKGIAYTKIVAFDGGTNAVQHCVIKDFEQKELGSRCIDAMTQIAAGNGNKDGYSIRAAALDLAKRTERRKILVVLSDGLPSGYFSEAEAIDDVRTAVQAARRRGLLVIPIIYTARTDENVDAYRRMYEKSILFADSVGMLGEFERLLMKLVR